MIDFPVEVIVVVVIDSWSDPSAKQISVGIGQVGKRIVAQYDVGLAKWQRLAKNVAKPWSWDGVVHRYRRTLPITLVCKKEKGFVTYDRSSQRTAKLIPHRIRLVSKDRLTSR